MRRKKRRSNTRFYLLILLFIILGGLTALYVALCRGNGYNHFGVANSEPTTVTANETQTEIPEETVTEEITEPETESETEPVSIPTEWSNYSPSENLLGEQWSITVINSRFSLGEKYVPTLVPVIEGSSVTVDTRIVDSYRQMYADALTENIILNPVTGYNSYHRQIEAYNDKVSSFTAQGMTKETAENEAAKRVGLPGCNESGGGLSVGIGSVSNGFSSSEKYTWLVNNAHKYGFVLRYPQDKTEITGMIYQPWLWRYVGVEAATEMKEKNLCLEEYLGVEN